MSVQSNVSQAAFADFQKATTKLARKMIVENAALLSNKEVEKVKLAERLDGLTLD